MAYTNKFEIDPEGFWNRFDELLSRQFKLENFSCRKDWFIAHGINYLTYTNAKRLYRVFSTDMCATFASLFQVSLDYLVTGEMPQYLTKAQTIVAQKPDIEKIVLGLNELNPQEYEYINLWLQSLSKNKKVAATNC